MSTFARAAAGAGAAAQEHDLQAVAAAAVGAYECAHRAAMAAHAARNAATTAATEAAAAVERCRAAARMARCLPQQTLPLPWEDPGHPLAAPTLAAVLRRTAAVGTGASLRPFVAACAAAGRPVAPLLLADDAAALRLCAAAGALELIEQAAAHTGPLRLADAGIFVDVLRLRDGSRYSGEVDAQGRRAGRGIARTASGACCRGEWRGDAPHGAAVFFDAPGVELWAGTYCDRRLVRGEAHAGKTALETDPACTAGALAAGHGGPRCGLGGVRGDMDTFVGRIRAGMDVLGRHSFRTGAMLLGRRADVTAGHTWLGLQVDPSGRGYLGECEDGQRHGWGVAAAAGGEKVFALWRAGRPVGPGAVEGTRGLELGVFTGTGFRALGSLLGVPPFAPPLTV